MGLSAKLQLRQAQSLVMTPQLLQSIRLLQFTHAELDRMIDEEIERNPLLERARDDEADPEPAGDIDGEAEGEDWLDLTGASTPERMAGEFDTALENIFPDEPPSGVADIAAPGMLASLRGEGAPLPDAGELSGSQRDLGQHLREQIALMLREPGERLIAAALLDALETDGYLRSDPAEIAGRLGIEPAMVAAVLSRCQQFDPPGLFARDLAECLGLQLAARDRLDPAMAAMLAHLDLVARRDFAQLRKVCGVDDADLLDMIDEIRALDPRPGLAFTVHTADVIVPDVVVQAAPDGSWLVELNPDALPRVLVDQTYAATICASVRDKAGRDFVGQCLQSANWLARSLDQRARTILKVASEIVRRQDAFLVHGVRHLRPLNLRTVADAIGMHESTVSRVTSNKFMMTPRGVFEFRYFFTVAIAASGGGDAHSSTAVRERIRELIGREEPDAVLSDDAIVVILKKDGVDIARRTVAKYREAMDIPSSVRRRREKRAMRAAAVD